MRNTPPTIFNISEHKMLKLVAGSKKKAPDISPMPKNFFYFSLLLINDDVHVHVHARVRGRGRAHSRVHAHQHFHSFRRLPSVG
jgi:hypothetical protein